MRKSKLLIQDLQNSQRIPIIKLTKIQKHGEELIPVKQVLHYHPKELRKEGLEKSDFIFYI